MVPRSSGRSRQDESPIFRSEEVARTCGRRSHCGGIGHGAGGSGRAAPHRSLASRHRGDEVAEGTANKPSY